MSKPTDQPINALRGGRGGQEVNKSTVAVDLFCGAGGTSTGLAKACGSAGRTLDLTAVNHNETAIATHAANHPKAKHLCHGLDDVDPRKVIRRRLDLLVASPECTHHSGARGGKPMSDQSRSTAWHVIRWTDALRPAFVLVENVREFLTWGPLIGRPDKLRPDPKRKGETFQAWLQALRSLGYTVDWRLLNAADYGDATSRTRLFVLARRGKGRLPWPEPTHEKEAAADLFGSRPRWRAAREVIDWSLPCPSIFGRKRPLSANTLKRIEAGLRRFGGANAEPFLVLLRGTGANQVPYTSRSTGDPVPVVAASGNHVGLCQPFLVPYYGTGESDDTADPLRTVTARDRLGLVHPDGVRVDIGFRMLQPHELARAMGFPDGYVFHGNREQRVRQIGNAVPVNLSYALARAILEAA